MGSSVSGEQCGWVVVWVGSSVGGEQCEWGAV